MRKFLLILSVFVLGIGLYFLFWENKLAILPSEFENEDTRVHMLDIGQGDSILIQTKRMNVLVDTGPPEGREKLLSALEKHHVKKLDYLILTHPHADHIGNAAAVLESISVGQVVESPSTTASPLVKKYYTVMKNKQVSLKIPTQNEVIDLGDQTHIRFLTPLPKFENTKNLNNSSLVFLLSFGSTKMIFTGDMEKELERALVVEYKSDLKAQILKSPHHGSSTSSSKVFLDAVVPKTVLISLEKDNMYGHPHQSVLKRYQALQLNIFRTDLNGDITVVENSQGYQVNVERKGLVK